MLQGFYRKSQGRSESLAHYVTRLEGKLKEICIKHPNKVSEAETGGYIWDHLFYSLRKPLREAIHAKLDNPLNDYMALMRVARKAEGEHEQEKHNTSCTSKLVVVGKGHPTKREVLILTPRLLFGSPGQNGLKCNSSSWWLLKGPKAYQKEPHNKDPIRVREGTVKALVPGARDLNGIVTAETMVQPEIIKLRPGGATKTRSNPMFVRVGGNET